MESERTGFDSQAPKFQPGEQVKVKRNTGEIENWNVGAVAFHEGDEIIILYNSKGDGRRYSKIKNPVEFQEFLDLNEKS